MAAVATCASARAVACQCLPWDSGRIGDDDGHRRQPPRQRQPWWVCGGGAATSHGWPLGGAAGVAAAALSSPRRGLAAGCARAAPEPVEGDVRPHPKGDGRWQRYDGKRWQFKCEAGGCKVQPLFGDPADGLARRCRKHRAEGDENVNSPRCPDCLAEDGRITIASFGVAGSGRRTHCARHGRPRQLVPL